MFKILVVIVSLSSLLMATSCKSSLPNKHGVYEVLSLTQIDALKIVAREAVKYPSASGRAYPTTLMAMSIQESSAGKQPIGDDQTSFGLLHFTVPTALEVASRNAEEFPALSTYASPTITKWDISRVKNMLVVEQTMNAKLGAIMFRENIDKPGWKYHNAVSRHNGGKNNTAYIEAVEFRKKQWSACLKMITREVRR